MLGTGVGTEVGTGVGKGMGLEVGSSKEYNVGGYLFVAIFVLVSIVVHDTASLLYSTIHDEG